ncbi:MAG: FAD-linked oxidase C-terminal domain-containing protein [Desulfobacterales bacterium]
MKKNSFHHFNQLRQMLEGEMHTDPLRLCMLSTDASIFRKEPVCIVYPKHTEDVVKTVCFALKNGFSVHPRGAGSGLCGSSLGSGIVLDFSRYMNRLLHLDTADKSFACEPGYRFGQLEEQLRGKGLFFPPDPSSGEYATFGGMYNTNASGAHSVKYGNVSDYILDAEIVLSTGQVMLLADMEKRGCADLPEPLQALFRVYTENAQQIETAYPPVRCNVAGYNLRELVQNDRLCLGKFFAGSEGTLGIVTRLKFRLADKPAHDSLAVAFSDDIVKSAKAVQRILPMQPSGIEVMDKSLLELARASDEKLRDKIPQGIDNVLLIEFDASDKEECARSAEEAIGLLKRENLCNQAYTAVSAAEKEKFWAVRKAAVPILYKLKGEKKILALIEDAAVPTDQLVAYFKGIYRILNHHNVSFVTYGHIAKGLLHTRPLLNLKDTQDVSLLKTLADEVFELVHSLGGTASGEHGDGRLRSAYIRCQYPEIWPIFARCKSLLDPRAILNPEIKTGHDPDQMKKHLRFGAAYHARDWKEKTLLWPEGFVTEAEKCHGCSKCTTVTSATRMCPVYKHTRDEAASPKAKANLLRGLISGTLADRSLYEKAFQQVMSLCIQCGSCFAECPSAVNIPKLAMEARAQYVQRFGVSLENRVSASAEMAGRSARQFSAFLKPVMNAEPARKTAEIFTGIAAQRNFPGFSGQSLFERISPVEGKGNLRVLYFAGCYAGYIRPEIGQAAVTVLKNMGMTVCTPKQHCCGLPMLSKGMTEQAGAKIRENLRQWRSFLKTADYLVVTCSSCGLSLMREWAYLADRADIRMIREKRIHISELIFRYKGRLHLKPYAKKAAYHMPCHLKVQPSADSSLYLLKSVPDLQVLNLKSLCCGMAGTWGMSAANFDLSRGIASDMIGCLEQARADVGLTDCPTCQMQMEQFGTTAVRHPVEIVAECLNC